jgi:hypothetical protein
MVGEVGSSSILTFKKDASTVRGYLYTRSSDDKLVLVSSGVNLYLSSTTGVINHYGDLVPSSDNAWDIGSPTMRLAKGFFADRLMIPVGANMFD